MRIPTSSALASSNELCQPEGLLLSIAVIAASGAYVATENHPLRSGE
ncbi:MAG TPA: hypothetical protein VL418_15865 [Devosiaceae bacterium]|jgi:hypothetical protein|nr:hypothetical protein [Devosiaceae bacterium]